MRFYVHRSSSWKKNDDRQLKRISNLFTRTENICIHNSIIQIDTAIIIRKTAHFNSCHIISLDSHRVQETLSGSRTPIPWNLDNKSLKEWE